MSESERKASSARAKLVPTVQWTFSAAYQERIRSTQVQVMVGRALPTSMSQLASAGQGGWNVDRLEEGRRRDMVKEIVGWQESTREDVLQRVAVVHRTSATLQRNASHVSYQGLRFGRLQDFRLCDGAVSNLPFVHLGPKGLYTLKAITRRKRAQIGKVIRTNTI